MKKIIVPLFFLLFFALMLFNPNITKSASLTGLNLWFFTLIPTLLPFMIISSIIMETGGYHYISFFLKPIMKYLFGLPQQTGYPFFIGLLCGFPMGSKITADMVLKKEISVRDGEILLTFCNNISPAFIISFLVSYVLGLNGYNAIAIITIMFISPIISGVIFSRLIFKSSSNSTSIYNISYINTYKSGNIMDTCIIQSFENIIKLGGYTILFTILSQFITNFINNSYLRCVISGLLEITSGLDTFSNTLISKTNLITTTCLLTSFGGLCSIAQTFSMINKTNLRLKVYICGKILNTIVTFTLTVIYCSII